MADEERARPDVTSWDIFPFTGQITVKPLEPPVLPEPPRDGEGSPCRTCSRSDDSYIWVDDDWRVSAGREPTAVPAVVMLESRAHHDLGDLPAPLAAELGPMIQRIEAALMSLGTVGRVHISRWGDGGSHFHLWHFARPLGAMQLRGTFLPLWDSVLPPLDAATWRANIDAVALALAEGGGRDPRLSSPAGSGKESS